MDSSLSHRRGIHTPSWIISAEPNPFTAQSSEYSKALCSLPKVCTHLSVVQGQDLFPPQKSQRTLKCSCSAIILTLASVSGKTARNCHLSRNGWYGGWRKALPAFPNTTLLLVSSSARTLVRRQQKLHSSKKPFFSQEINPPNEECARGFKRREIHLPVSVRVYPKKAFESPTQRVYDHQTRCKKVQILAG